MGASTVDVLPKLTYQPQNNITRRNPQAIAHLKVKCCCRQGRADNFLVKIVMHLQNKRIKFASRPMRGFPQQNYLLYFLGFRGLFLFSKA